eukprot:274428-Chlamydomonas_euryale.AAC.5
MQLVQRDAVYRIARAGANVAAGADVAARLLPMVKPSPTTADATILPGMLGARSHPCGGAAHAVPGQHSALTAAARTRSR